MKSVLVSAAVVGTAMGSMTCPSTAAWGPACGMKITTTASATCDNVLAEMKARIAGQASGKWHDPHNKGTYAEQSYGGTFSTSRLTGDGKYTDKEIFTLTASGSSCLIEACSRSQVTSVLDKGTNYCDLKMLFCGSKDGCKPVLNDFTVGSEQTEKFSQSSVDLSACLQVSAEAPLVQMEPDVESHDPATSSWVKGDAPPSDHPVTVTVAVQVDADRRAELERVFWEVSDPDSNGYGMHRNTEQITEILAVPEERIGNIQNFFMNSGASMAVVSPNRDMVTVTMSASVAEDVLQTKLHFFTHPEVPDFTLVRAAHHYYLPEYVAKDVVMVGGLLQFPLIRPQLSLRVAGAGTWPNDCSAAACKGLVTPGVLATRYKLPNATDNVANNAMAVAEFQGQYYKTTDIQSFSTSCHRDVTVAKNVGANQQSAGIESELDIEYIKSVAPEVPLTVVYNAQYSLLNWANQITSMADTPQVHSVSYGNDEAQQSSREFMLTANTAFMKAGAKGISILFASGDQGVCGREGCGILKFRFKPDFPAGSPYITSVGGTDFKSTPPTIGEETAWQSGGGGFSDTFGIPDFQKDAVAAYKSNPDANLPPAAYWNASGRGYPDISALGGTKTPYCVATSGQFTGVAGTSASCPVAAGVFAKLNGLRLAKGMPPMGFLNPFIYKNPSGFQDVTSGINKASRNYGFTAVKGWDAATGMGTPDFEALSTLAMAAGSRIRTPSAASIVV